MVNQNLSGLLKGILRKNGTVGCNLNNQFFVVGVSLVDSDSIDSIVGGAIFIGGDPTTTLVDCEVKLETCAGIQMTNDLVRVENLKSCKRLANVTGLEHLLP